MAKIINFKSTNSQVIDFLKEAIDIVKDKNIDNVLISFKVKDDNSIMTGYCNLDMGEKQELVSHIQIDIVRDMINQNYIT